MKILAISGTYRVGKTIDTLIDKAIEGLKSEEPDVEVTKISLIRKKIEYCRNCIVCKNVEPDEIISRCIIEDDMQEIYPLLFEADAYIFGTPINVGDATAVMKTFIERTAWVMAKPGPNSFPIKGIPEPRNPKKKKAIIILSSGAVPPLLRIFCDSATSLIKSLCESCLNAKIVGSIYAGAIEKRGVDFYLKHASDLGKKLI
jgi:multimeric flavodoxin WrbA